MNEEFTVSLPIGVATIISLALPSLVLPVHSVSVPPSLYTLKCDGYAHEKPYASLLNVVYVGFGTAEDDDDETAGACVGKVIGGRVGICVGTGVGVGVDAGVEAGVEIGVGVGAGSGSLLLPKGHIPEYAA